MGKPKTKTKLKEKENPLETDPVQPPSQSDVVIRSEPRIRTREEIEKADEEYYKRESKKPFVASPKVVSLFKRWEEKEFEPQDLLTEIPIDSLESAVGYSSLFRQMHRAFVRRVAFYRSDVGGGLTLEKAREAAFHQCQDDEEAQKQLDSLFSLPLESLNFADLMILQECAPRVAEQFWEYVKVEGRKEFESGHLAANITFPEGYMKGMWNIARYLGVRESFIDEWNPRGGLELSLIEMLAQSFFQWQYWIEQTVKRSQTRGRDVHPEYERFLARKKAEYKIAGWTDGYWFRPLVSEQEAIEHGVQMADRFNRIFMRTLRQLRDLRRYAPVTINNPSQVNIANDGGQQINVSKEREIDTKEIGP